MNRGVETGSVAMAVVIASSTFVLILFAGRPEVSSSVAVATELVDSICTDAIILASWLIILVNTVIDIDLAPRSSIPGRAAAGLVVDAIDTDGPIRTEVAGTVIDVGTNGAVAGKASIAHTVMRAFGVGTQRVGITVVSALALVNVGTSSSTGGNIPAVTAVSLRALAGMSGDGVGADGVGVAVMSGGGALIDIGTHLAISLVPSLACARVRPDGLVGAHSVHVAEGGIVRALVHILGTGGSGPVQLSVGGGADTGVVARSRLLLAFATVVAGVGVAVIGRHGRGRGRSRR